MSYIIDRTNYLFSPNDSPYKNARLVEVPVVGELEPGSVFIGDDMRPCAHATVMPPPDGSVEKAVGAGVEAFQKAFNESMESRGM